MFYRHCGQGFSIDPNRAFLVYFRKNEPHRLAFFGLKAESIQKKMNANNFLPPKKSYLKTTTLFQW